MGEETDAPRVIVNSGDPRRWIAAIVGGVLLGEALWAMLQLLIRDWAMPAILNATGQGPTQNRAAFEPLPLLVAFVEACAAGIVLLLLMKWAQRQTRVIVTGRAVTGAVAASDKAVRSQAEALPVARVAPVAAPAPVMAPAPPIAVAANPVVPAPLITTPPTTPIAARVPATVPAVAPVTAASQAPVATPKPTQPPAPKKPKVVYYNSVGEPIEE